MMFFTRHLVVFALSLLTFSPCANADCKNFTQSTDYYTEPANATQRVSQGYICDAPNSNYETEVHMICSRTTQCPYFHGGLVSAQGTNNLSLSENDILPIYTLIPTKTTVKSEPFLYSYSSKLDNTTGCLDVQPRNSSSISAGFYGFTPNLICVDGTLSACSDGPVDDNTAIQVCGVATWGTIDDARVDGELNFVTTDDFDALASETSNPAETASPLVTLPEHVLKNAAVGGKIPQGVGLGLTLGAMLGASLIL